MEGKRYFRINTSALARLCGCESPSELVQALRRSGQTFSADHATTSASTRRQDAAALRDWFRRYDMPSAPRVNVAVVSTASRPGPLDTPSKPKALLRVGDATLLSHCLRGICCAGVRHVVLVLGGPTNDSISRHLAEMNWSSYFQTLRIVDLGAEYSSGHASSLLAAARVLLGPTQIPRPFLLVGVDHVYHHNILRELVNTPYLDGSTRRKESTAGVVLVETDPKTIARMRLNTHSTSVRVVVGAQTSDDQHNARLVSPVVTDEIVDNVRVDFLLSGHRRQATSQPPERDELSMHDVNWVHEIGRDLEAYNGIEAGAFVLSTRVFDALRGLARAAPYFTLAEALAKFCRKGQSSQLRAAETGGMPWIAIESAEQQVEATLSGSELFRFARTTEGRRHCLRGVAVNVDVALESNRLGVFDTYTEEIPHHPTIVELSSSMEEAERKGVGSVTFDRQPESFVSQREATALHSAGKESGFPKRTLQRKISSSSLAQLLETYEDAEYDDDTSMSAKVDSSAAPGANIGVLVANTADAAMPGRAALAIFEEAEEDEEDRESDTSSTVNEEDKLLIESKKGEAVAEAKTALVNNRRRVLPYKFGHIKRRRISYEAVVPPNDIERVRIRLFTPVDSPDRQPKLAVRVERRVPLSGWAVLVVACVACASTSAFERSLPDGVTGALRSLWRQSVTTILLSAVEAVRPAAVAIYLFVNRNRKLRTTAARQQHQQPTSDKLSTDQSPFFGDRPRSCRQSAETDVKSSVPGNRSSLAAALRRCASLIARRCCVSPVGREMLREVMVSNGDSARPILQTKGNFPREAAEKENEHKRRSSSIYSRTERVAIVIAVVVGFAVQNLALCVAFLFVPTAIALTLVNSTPLWLVGYAVLFTTKPPRRIVTFAAVIGFVGAVVLCAAELNAASNATQTKNPLVGVIIGAVGGLGGALYVSAAKRAKAVPPTRLLLFANAGAVLFTFLIVLGQSRDSVRKPVDREQGIFGWMAAGNRTKSIFLSLIVDGVGILGVLLALRFVDPLVVTVSLQLEPIMAAIVDSFVGVGTLSSMSRTTYIGSSIVLTSCAIVVTTNAKSKDDIDATEALEPMPSLKRRTDFSAEDGASPPLPPQWRNPPSAQNRARDADGNFAPFATMASSKYKADAASGKNIGSANPFQSGYMSGYAKTVPISSGSTQHEFVPQYATVGTANQDVPEPPLFDGSGRRAAAHATRRSV